MVRLTAQLINMSAQKHNPVRDWELDLRGYRIPVIENLGATLDQFDTIDFTDNDIRKLDKFPLLKRLKNVMLSNNRIVRIAENLEENLPSLETLILTNNSLKELADIDPLSTVTTLKYVSFLGNPLVTKKNYRLYVIYKIPSLRVLDFCRVKQREREAASKLFKKRKGQAQLPPQQTGVENGTRAKTFTPGEKLTPAKPVPTGPSRHDVAAIRRAIANAQTLEEIERLNQLLKSGQIPGQDSTQSSSGNEPRGNQPLKEEVEEEEEEEEEEEVEQQNDEDSNQASGFERMEDDNDDGSNEKEEMDEDNDMEEEEEEEDDDDDEDDN